jgi:hypothetical protein
MIKLKPRLRWMNRQLHWIWGTEVSASGAHPLSFHLTKKPFVGGSLTLGFFSMRHSAISEQEVDFQEHCVGKLWVV